MISRVRFPIIRPSDVRGGTGGLEEP